MTRVLIGDTLVNENERLQLRINALLDKDEASLKQALRIAATQENLKHDADFGALANLLRCYAVGRWEQYAPSGLSREPLAQWSQQWPMLYFACLLLGPLPARRRPRLPGRAPLRPPGRRRPPTRTMETFHDGPKLSGPVQRGFIALSTTVQRCPARPAQRRPIVNALPGSRAACLTEPCPKEHVHRNRKPGGIATPRRIVLRSGHG